MTTAKGTIKHNNWDEQPYHDSKVQKGTIARIDIVFSGDLTGDARTAYAMAYNEGGATCHYAGHLLFEGKLGAKSGSFTIFEQGVYEGGTATSSWDIVAGSGTGDFAGITGSGSYAATHDNTVHYTLNCNLK